MAIYVSLCNACRYTQALYFGRLAKVLTLGLKNDPNPTEAMVQDALQDPACSLTSLTGAATRSTLHINSNLVLSKVAVANLVRVSNITHILANHCGTTFGPDLCVAGAAAFLGYCGEAIPEGLGHSESWARQKIESADYVLLACLLQQKVGARAAGEACKTVLDASARDLEKEAQDMGDAKRKADLRHASLLVAQASMLLAYPRGSNSAYGDENARVAANNIVPWP